MCIESVSHTAASTTWSAGGGGFTPGGAGSSRDTCSRGMSAPASAPTGPTRRHRPPPPRCRRRQHRRHAATGRRVGVISLSIGNKYTSTPIDLAAPSIVEQQGGHVGWGTDDESTTRPLMYYFVPHSLRIMKLLDATAGSWCGLRNLHFCKLILVNHGEPHISHRS